MEMKCLLGLAQAIEINRVYHHHHEQQQHYSNTTLEPLEYRVRTTVGSTARKVSHRIASGLGEGTRESPGLGKEVPCSAVQFQNAGGELVLNNYSTVATRCALGAKMCEAIAKEVRTRTVWSPVGSRIVSCD